MILQFQKEIALSEDLLIAQRRLFCTCIIIAVQRARDLTCQTRTGTDNALMILFQHLQIDTRLVIIALGEALGHDLDQIRIAGIVLGEQDQMVIAVFAASRLPVKTRARRDIYLAA